MADEKGTGGHVIEARNSWVRVKYASQYGTLNIMNQGDTTLWLRVDDEHGQDVGMISFDLSTGHLFASDDQSDSGVGDVPQAFDSGAVINVGYGQCLSGIRVGDHTLTTRWFSNKGPHFYIENAAGKEVARAWFDFSAGKIWDICDR